MEVCGVSVEAVDEVCATGWHALVLVTCEDVVPPQALEDFVTAHHEFDPTSKETGAVSVVRCARVSGGKLVLAATGPLSPYDDVRSVSEAARAGVRRAVAAGARRVLLALQPHPRFPRAPLVALLAALEALYVPLQMRETYPGRVETASALGVYGEGLGEPLAALIADAVALEKGRVLSRDVGGGDPERMTALRCAEHIAASLQGSDVTVRVLDDAAAIRERYPLFAAVTRAADTVPRHRGCIVFLEFTPHEYERTLMFVGKGVTYDTGGADVKVGGAMAGMSRDKCGAAAIAGLFKTLSVVGADKARVRALAALGFARNSIGADCYVADELLRARCGLPVRVGNTDAEGRLVMADLLAEMVERAGAEKAPHVYTVATLTGHAVRCAGAGYGVAVDNAAAHAAGHAAKLQRLGERLGDMLEVSRLRREDGAAHAGRGGGEALLQALPAPSASLPRGHQGPAAFLLAAARLDHAQPPLPYTHLDVAGAAGDVPHPPTAAPLLTLAAAAGLVAV